MNQPGQTPEAEDGVWRRTADGLFDAITALCNDTVARARQEGLHRHDAESAALYALCNALAAYIGHVAAFWHNDPARESPDALTKVFSALVDAAGRALPTAFLPTAGERAGHA